jgi:hypothetical protein
MNRVAEYPDIEKFFRFIKIEINSCNSWPKKRAT